MGDCSTCMDVAEKSNVFGRVRLVLFRTSIVSKFPCVALRQMIWRSVTRNNGNSFLNKLSDVTSFVSALETARGEGLSRNARRHKFSEFLRTDVEGGSASLHPSIPRKVEVWISTPVQ